MYEVHPRSNRKKENKKRMVTVRRIVFFLISQGIHRGSDCTVVFISTKFWMRWQRPRLRQMWWQILVENRSRFIAGNFKAFLDFLLWFSSHWPEHQFLFFQDFFAKSLKSEGERLQVKFLPSEMVKIGRGRRCRRRRCLQRKIVRF
jgi:hypothetical protein